VSPRGLALGFVFALLGAAFVGAFGPAIAPDATGKQGGDLKVGLLENPITDPLSPAAWRDGNVQVLDLLYDSLARLDPVTQDFVPALANSWWYDPATLEYMVDIRADARFDDATPITAGAVERSLEQYARFTGTVRTVDADTVAVNLTTVGNGYFWLEALTAKIAWDATGNMKESGPFGLGVVPTTPPVLYANTHYWNGRPNLDSITYRVYNGNMTALSCAMLNNSANLDLIGFHLSPNDIYTEYTGTACGYPAGAGQNRSLINPTPSKTQPWTMLVKNPGTKMLYVGYDYANPVFGGADGMAMRQAIYGLMNKGLYRDVEPNSVVTQGLVPSQDVAWYNPAWVYTSDPGFTGTGAAKRTASDAAERDLVAAGFFDADGDGWREHPTEGAFSLDLATTSFSLDARKPVIAGDIESILKKTGINTVTKQYDSWTLLAQAHDGVGGNDDLYLDTYDPLTTVPSYLWKLPEIMGANDADTDLHMGLAAACTDLPCVRLHVAHSMYYATKNAVISPLLHYESLEVVNTANYEGWVNAVGGANNVWSMTNLAAPFNGPMTVEILPLVETLSGGDSITVPVLVTDSSGSSIKNATVTVWTDTGASSPATDDGVAPDQAANDGVYTAGFTAPAVGVPTDWWFTATGYRQTYQSDSDMASVTVHPEFGRLQLRTAWSDPDRTITSGGTATLTMTVLDSANGRGLAGAVVEYTISLTGASLTAASRITNGNGEVNFTFTGAVTQRTTFSVSLVASATGYVSQPTTASLVVEPTPQSPPTVKKVENVPGLEAVGLLAVVALMGVAIRLSRKEGE